MNKLLIAAAMLALATPGFAATGTATIQGTAAGSTVGGTVTLQDTDAGLKVTAKLTGLPAGDHGFHIHEFGSCDDAGKAAGGHYNPKGAPHGFLPKAGSLKKAHGGDMGNVKAGADGAAQLEVVLPHVTLADGKYTVAGRAIIIHEKVDDFSQPTGNAGGRIGCGVIAITGK